MPIAVISQKSNRRWVGGKNQFIHYPNILIFAQALIHLNNQLSVMKLFNPKYAIAAFAIILFFSWKKQTQINGKWKELGGKNTSTFHDIIKSITIDTTGKVYAAGRFVNDYGNCYIAKWNGMAWSEQGGSNGSTFNNEIRNIAIDAKGNVFATGSFMNTRGNYFVAEYKQ